MKLLRRPISASDRILDRFYIISMELLSLSRRRSSSRNVLQRRWARRNVCCSQAKNYDKVALWYKEVATRIDCCRILCCFLLSSYKYIWNVRCLYLIWNLAKTFQRNDLSRTIHSAGYEFCRAAAIWALSKGSLQYTLLEKFAMNRESFNFKELTILSSLAASAIVKYRCAIYVDVIRVISNKQSIFFPSDQHAVIANKLAFTSLHCSISNYTLKRQNKQHC